MKKIFNNTFRVNIDFEMSSLTMKIKPWRKVFHNIFRDNIDFVKTFLPLEASETNILKIFKEVSCLDTGFYTCFLVICIVYKSVFSNRNIGFSYAIKS